MMLLAHHVPFLAYADWFELVTFVVTAIGVWYSHLVWQESRRHRYAAKSEGQWMIVQATIERTSLMVWIQLALCAGATYCLFAPPPGDGQVFGLQAQITRVSIVAASIIGVRKSFNEKQRREDLWRYFDRRKVADAAGVDARKDAAERSGPKRDGDL